ncbi:MAG: putative hydro-lyase [Deltaproteobacteria bacterium]|nr:MAG: putative hydro-lyase [Deltaproteobacteria bacterium]RTZ98456.1 MAG: putative hydro-lyase [Deltaproteobacteria bacterium]
MNQKRSARELRQHIRSGHWTAQTSGAAAGYVQANLVMLPLREAFHFLLFCTRNSKPCPVLDVLDPGEVEPSIARGADLTTDLPRYRVFRRGEMVDEVTDVKALFDEETVSFLLGCSFSFENAMRAAGLPVRNIEEGKNVSMYKTNRPCRPAGPFHAPLVVSMRPLTPAQAVRAVQVTSRFYLTHGAPVHMGDPAELGIADLARPDFGDPVEIRPGEIPVFWACGVTSSLSAVSARLPLTITHSPGHMFVSDLKDEEMTVL